MTDLIVPNIICFQTQKQPATLNNIQVLYRSVLTDLRACHFVHMKTSLRARFVHIRHRAHNLSSPVYLSENGFSYGSQIPIFLSYALSDGNSTLAKATAKTPDFPIRNVSCFVFITFTCFTAKFCHLWLQNITNKQLESLQQSTERQTHRGRKGDLLLFSLAFVCDFFIIYIFFVTFSRVIR